ncbi:hypothetical protein EG329_004673 [Mollisiaceae sp. DMI_Dod_QoI]|nr:hypothetical protein EG329_004673 [Helotiales sp. DMI_Dod_QoI]
MSVDRLTSAGFCDNPELGSYTWFDAGVSTFPKRDRIPHNFIQFNITASPKFKEHRVSWDLCTTDESHRQWIGRIRSGDSVQIIPRAKWQAWVNYVKFARIEVHCKMVQNSDSPISPISTVSKDHTETVRTVQDSYQHYQELNRDRQELRLLILQPGSLEDPICCHLITSSLQESPAPVFEALSYCWGNVADTRSIKLSYTSTPKGPTQYQVFTITSSLHEALRHLRHSDGRSRTLWVDSVCINQNNLQERGAQVNMMGDIYSHANLVRVWLGESDAASTRAMASVRVISGGNFLGGKDHNTVYWNTLKDISRLFNYPWFSRVWVLQEVWKARKAIVSCGMDSVPWESIIQTNLWMLDGHSGGLPGFDFQTLPSIWTKLAGIRNPEVEQNARKRNPGIEQEARNMAKRSEQNSCLELLDLVLESTSLNATDPKDKIYSLLGMCQEIQGTDFIPSALRPDYTRTPSKIFTDFTRWWIVEHKSLVILSAVHASPNQAWQELGCSVSSMPRPSRFPADHPSWALWHEGDGKWAKRTLGMSSLYKAAGNTLPLLDSSNATSSQLSLAGVRIGVVASTHPYPFYETEENQLHEAYIRLFDPAGSFGTWNFGNTIPNYTKEKEKIAYVDHFFSHGGNRNSPFPCHGTPLFRTSEGSLGLCPPRAQPNDIIVILYGGPVPFILRERDGYGRQPNMAVQYELIGECYVQGYMHGGVIEEAQRCNIPPQQFVLV